MVPIITVLLVLSGIGSSSPGDRISIRAALFSPQAEDMKDAYGLVPFFGIGGDFPVGENQSAFFLLNGVYKNGSFHYHSDYYETRLRALLAVVGSSLKSSEENRSLSIGGGIVVAWAGEGLPEMGSSGRIYLRDRTGISMGALLSGEFDFLVKSNLSIGVEGRYQFLSVRIKYKPDGSDWQYYNLDLSGLSVGPYLSYYLR